MSEHQRNESRRMVWKPYDMYLWHLAVCKYTRSFKKSNWMVYRIRRNELGCSISWLSSLLLYKCLAWQPNGSDIHAGYTLYDAGGQGQRSWFVQVKEGQALVSCYD